MVEKLFANPYESILENKIFDLDILQHILVGILDIHEQDAYKIFPIVDLKLQEFG